MLRLQNDVPPLRFFNDTKEDKSMYSRKLRMLTVLLAVWFVFMPVQRAMAQSVGASAAGAVTLPIVGTVSFSDQTTGMFNGSFTINSFDTAAINNQQIANGIITGTITNSGGVVVASGIQSAVLPVVLSALNGIVMKTPLSEGPRVIPAAFTPAASPRAAPMQASGCGVLQMSVGGGAAVNVLGFNVALNPAMINVSGSASGGIGGLVCQILGTIGSLLGLNPTALLNSLLGTITGLLRGTTGGLLGGIL
jgi:hypothetical protein